MKQKPRKVSVQEWSIYSFLCLCFWPKKRRTWEAEWHKAQERWALPFPCFCVCCSLQRKRKRNDTKPTEGGRALEDWLSPSLYKTIVFVFAFLFIQNKRHLEGAMTQSPRKVSLGSAWPPLKNGTRCTSAKDGAVMWVLSVRYEK